MFANRFTVLIDACSLAGALKRNLLLTLAEAGFFRVRWSSLIMDETKRAIREILRRRGLADPPFAARRARRYMEDAFAEALVTDFDTLLPSCLALPDANDAHVLAAALRAQAAIIVTENVRHFPPQILAPFDLEAKTADDFIADTLGLNIVSGLEAIRLMRERFARPPLDAAGLLSRMEAEGLTATVAAL